ncbi:MAG: thioredoxin family protein [Hyphomicrobium sp.]
MTFKLFVRTALATVALAVSTSAFALETKTYDAAAFKAAQDAGKSILIDVHAPWCPTCKAQAAVLETLKDKPAYKDLTVYRVDFDSETAALKAFKVTQQSTLIAFKGATETGRSIGATKADAIETLLMSATK